MNLTENGYLTIDGLTSLVLFTLSLGFLPSSFEIITALTTQTGNIRERQRKLYQKGKKIIIHLSECAICVCAWGNRDLTYPDHQAHLPTAGTLESQSIPNQGKDKGNKETLSTPRNYSTLSQTELTAAWCLRTLREDTPA